MSIAIKAGPLYFKCFSLSCSSMLEHPLIVFFDFNFLKMYIVAMNNKSTDRTDSSLILGSLVNKCVNVSMLIALPLCISH